jgi:hypothetical protein
MHILVPLHPTTSTATTARSCKDGYNRVKRADKDTMEASERIHKNGEGFVMDNPLDEHINRCK